MNDSDTAPRLVPADILLIEDDPADELLIREAFADGKLVNRLVVARDGDSALAMLREHGSDAAVQVPELILLDLTLPGLDGRDLLAVIKADPDLAAIPVIVLTDSRSEQDILRSYRLRVDGYLTKPVEFPALADVIRRIDELYLYVVRRPVAVPAGPH